MARIWRTATWIALGALLIFAATALAGGWVTATVTDPPDDPTAGTGTVIGVELKQHGETPIAWEQLYFMATNRDNGDDVFAKGRPEGAVGRYVIDVTFPSAGRWEWRLQTLDLILEPGQYTSIAVTPGTGAAAAQPAAGGQQPGGTAAQPAQATTLTTASRGLDPAVAVGGGIVAFLLGGLAGYVVRRPRPTAVERSVPVAGELARVDPRV